MTFESFSRQVEDDGEPSTALNIAGKAVRDFNHRSHDYMRITRPGWRSAPDAYQALGQIIKALRHELDLNLIGIDAGTPYAGDPAVAIEAVNIALDTATRAAEALYQQLTDAQAAISAAHYTGLDSDEPDEALS